jgi:hypothetical protein
MLLVNENISTSRKPSISARPSADVKRQFVELATRLRVSESALMLIAIRSLLESQRIAAPAETGTLPPEREPSTDRVKVTGGGNNAGAVAAHFSYIGRQDELAIETDEGDRIVGRDEQKALLKDWHLELSAGQYALPETDAPPPAKRSSSTTSFSRCPSPPRRKKSWPQPACSAARNSGPSTDMQWCCIPIRSTPTCIWL